MITSTLNSPANLDSNHYDLFGVWTGGTRQSCIHQIKTLEGRLKEFDHDTKTRSHCQSRLTQANRFLQSDEFGSCEYELQIVELLISEAIHEPE